MTQAKKKLQKKQKAVKTMKRFEEIDTKNLLCFEGNPRFDSMIKEGLFEDIKQHGVLMPLLVSPIKNGKYQVIDGERRRKSAVKLKIPALTCIIEDMDDETKWRRAYDLNILNKPFNPMESAKNFYERKKRFLYSDETLAQLTSIELTQANVSIRIALNKLPQEIQDLVADESLPVTVGYELSRLAFDVSFPSIGKSKSVKDWVKVKKGRVWDFNWSKEPQKWKEELTKLQKLLADKWINNKMTTNNLKSRVDDAIKNEKNRRSFESKQRTELIAEIQKLESEINSAFDLYNKGFLGGLAKLIPDVKERKASSLNKYLIDKKNLPKDFDDFIYDLTMDINKKMPDDKRMKLVRDARNSTVVFNNKLKKKDPIIFEVAPEPSCNQCGHEIDSTKSENYFKLVDRLLTEMEDRKNLIAEVRDTAVKTLKKLHSNTNRIKTLKNSFKELEKEEA